MKIILGLWLATVALLLNFARGRQTPKQARRRYEFDDQHFI
jgi:hypothetical protein